MTNTFELIKKSRPKIKIGDIFYYKINNSFYAGIVLHNYLKPTLGEGTMITCAFLETKYASLKEVTVNQLKQDLIEKRLLLPPINTNKRGWTHGCFVTIDNLSLDFAKSMLKDVRFFYGAETIYNMNYVEVPDCPDFKLCGKVALVAHEGIELLLQISLDLDFTEENPTWYDPYKYYRELKEEGFKGDYPFWYLKAKERLKNVDSSKNLI